MTARTRVRLDEDVRRGQIVAATIRVLAERGWDGATLTLITEAAGVSKGLLWHYFEGRDELMRQAARETVAKVREEIAAELDLTRPVPEVIRGALARAAQLPASHATELAALDQIIHNLRVDGRPGLSMSDYEETYRAQETLFRRGQDEGTITTDLDLRVLAVTYQGAIDAMLGYLASHPDVDPDRYATLLADLLLAGLTPR